MKNIANCTPREFLRQTNKIRKAVSNWLTLTKVMDIRERLRKHDVPGAVRPALPPSLAATASLAENLGYLTAVEGNSVIFVTTAEDFIDSLADEIDHAKSEVSLLYYIFKSFK